VIDVSGMLQLIQLTESLSPFWKIKLAFWIMGIFQSLSTTAKVMNTDRFLLLVNILESMRAFFELRDVLIFIVQNSTDKSILRIAVTIFRKHIEVWNLICSLDLVFDSVWIKYKLMKKNGGHIPIHLLNFLDFMKNIPWLQIEAEKKDILYKDLESRKKRVICIKIVC
jgi:hypothetical protein